MFGKIQHAELTWQSIDGIDIPCSKQFGDVYFSKDNGLLETRHVFLNGNDLPQRLSQLDDYAYFSVGETGFGTGLNILALWQLWQDVRPNNHSHLHVVSVEKYPLTLTDLKRALKAWPELRALSEQLISQYPNAIPGCHRLHFTQERFSIDLWFGDASDTLPIISTYTPINAWFLDGFAPSCNPELWQTHILAHIIRLSNIGTTFSSFSVAGVIKRGLKEHGIQISRPKGFGHKREMLKAIWPAPAEPPQKHPRQCQTIAVIGAGIAGLTTAWAFAKRGHKVHVFEKTAPLSGGSGNPLALINPKLCPINQAHEHLMLLSWQFALNHYAPFKAFHPISVQQSDLKKTGDLHTLAEDYPKGTFSQDHNPMAVYPTVTLIQAGAIQPHQLKDEILAHPNIQLYQSDITSLKQTNTHVILNHTQQQIIKADYVVVCTAIASHQLIPEHPTLKPIRGQVSWFNTIQTPLDTNTALSYGGYMAQMTSTEIILGASFQPNQMNTDILPDDHEHNLSLLHQAYPTYKQYFPPTDTWQGRCSLRAQSPDYFPLVGIIHENSRIYTCSGLGSKGFLFAPLCAEIIAAQILKELLPIPKSLLDKLNAQRFKKKQKIKKPYFKGNKTLKITDT